MSKEELRGIDMSLHVMEYQSLTDGSMESVKFLPGTELVTVQIRTTKRILTFRDVPPGCISEEAVDDD